MNRIAWWLCTFFRSGELPRAPGTWGSIAAFPLVYLLHLGSTWTYWGAFVLLFILSLWAIPVVVRQLQKPDPSVIVVDEVLGMLLALAFTPFDPFFWTLCFILFRVFDILKIPPVRELDQWSKIHHSKGNLTAEAFFIIADDLVAAIQAILVIQLILTLGIL